MGSHHFSTLVKLTVASLQIFYNMPPKAFTTCRCNHVSVICIYHIIITNAPLYFDCIAPGMVERDDGQKEIRTLCTKEG